MFGHRPDGKKVKGLDPIFRVIPNVMLDRDDSQVYFKQDIPLKNLDEYIDRKMAEGIRFSYMDIIYAAIVILFHESEANLSRKWFPTSSVPFRLEGIKSCEQ